MREIQRRGIRADDAIYLACVEGSTGWWIRRRWREALGTNMTCAAAPVVAAVGARAGRFLQDATRAWSSVFCNPLAEETHGEPGEIVVSRRDALATASGEGDAPEFHFDTSLHVFEFIVFVFYQIHNSSVTTDGDRHGS